MRLFVLLLVISLLAPAQQSLKWVSEVEFSEPWEGVPEAYRKLPFGELRNPSSRAEWENKRPEIRAVLDGALGEIPPRPKTLDVRRIR